MYMKTATIVSVFPVFSANLNRLHVKSSNMWRWILHGGVLHHGFHD